VRVAGFSILNFPGDGVLVLYGLRITLEDNTAIANGEYGFASFQSESFTFRNNRAEENPVAGLYLGDTTGPRNLIVGNRATNNGEFGFFISDAFGGSVLGNTAVDNCSGFMFLDTGAGGPGNTRGWRVEENVASDNNQVCPGGQGSPPTSGAGIVLYGAQSLIVEDNTVQDNNSGAPSLANGGIVLRDATAFGGGPVEANVVQTNTARRNLPFDIDAAGETETNVIRFNVCQLGNPPEVCPTSP
jgi:parallel beta-helix repeat protein